jgi:DNA-binding MarR family transcriptional regulator
VNRLEERALLTRVLCADDRRGLYTELTHAGQRLLDEATPVHAAALEEALAEAREVPELEELAVAVDRLEGATV